MTSSTSERELCLKLRDVLPTNSCISAVFDREPKFEDVVVDGAAEVPCGEHLVCSSQLESANILLRLGGAAKSKEDLISKLPKLTPVEVNQIETVTIGQSSNEEWRRQRHGRITASNFYSVYTRVNTIKSAPSKVHNVDPILKKIMGYDDISSLEHVPALKHGRAYEPIARERYVHLMERKHQGFKYRECGLFVDGERPYLGASPDLIVSCDCCGQGLAEFKCPYSTAQEIPSADNLNYLIKEKDGSTTLRQEHAYYAQVQGQLALCRRNYFDFYVYTHAGQFLQRIEYDEGYWSRLSDNLEYFFLNFLADELVSSKTAT